jgi:hypothetical protein
VNGSRWLVLGLILATSGCAPAQRPTRPSRPKPAEPAPAVEPKAAVIEEAALQAPQRLLTTLGAISIEGVSFDSRSHRLRVLDQAKGPASIWQNCSQAGASINGLAAINAGFFTPEGAPLGLLASGGTFSGTWNGGSSLGSALWYRDGNGRCGIVRREVLGVAAARKLPDLLQAGPLLVESGKAVAKLEATKVSARSFLLWDGGTRWLMARSAPCSLAQLADALASSSPAGWPGKSALNLDGGRSSELWISSSVQGGPSFVRPIWNNPVRNYLVLCPARP